MNKIINCECGGLTKVIDSRVREKSIYRRRQCQKCQVIFPTYETKIKPLEETKLRLKVADLIQQLVKTKKQLSQLIKDD